MRTVGALLLVAAALAAVLGSLVPVSTATYNCGPAALNIAERTAPPPNNNFLNPTVDQATLHNCAVLGRQRLIVFGGITIVLAIAGLIVVATGGGRSGPAAAGTPAAPPGWYLSAEGDEERWWDGRMWTPHRRPRAR
jgi:hypothetical protein